jgi:hypothetical protein
VDYDTWKLATPPALDPPTCVDCGAECDGTTDQPVNLSGRDGYYCAACWRERREPDDAE